MPDSIDCLRCHVPMERGFIADRAVGRWVQEHWSPGDPTVYLWTLLPGKGTLPVITMRCTRCGLLESYAQST
jgi:hypothetical protein